MPKNLRKPIYSVIVAPTDGSDAERPAIDLAASLAKTFNAELRLVRVETPPVVVDPALGPGVLEQTEQTVAEARLTRQKKLEALGAEYRAGGVARVLTSLESGLVAPTLRDYAKRFNADLIVMSSHARGGVKRITLGSVADYLIRNTEAPVLVAKPSFSAAEHGPNRTFNRIVVPLDGSDLAEQILPQVAALGARLQSRVTLLQVLTPSTYSQKQIMQPGLPWWDAEMAVADAYLDRGVTLLAKGGLSATKEVLLSEDVPSAIIDYCARSEVDLLAFATHGRGGIKRLMFGTVADELTRRSPISLLVFHPGTPNPKH